MIITYIDFVFIVSDVCMKQSKVSDHMSPECTDSMQICENIRPAAACCSGWIFVVSQDTGAGQLA